jgi:hypothetical protein
MTSLERNMAVGRRNYYGNTGFTDFQLAKPVNNSDTIDPHLCLVIKPISLIFLDAIDSYP